MRRLMALFLCCLLPVGCGGKSSKGRGTPRGSVDVVERGHSYDPEPQWCPYCGEWDEPHCVGFGITVDLEKPERSSDGSSVTKVSGLEMYCSNCDGMFVGQFVDLKGE